MVAGAGPSLVVWWLVVPGRIQLPSGQHCWAGPSCTWPIWSCEGGNVRTMAQHQFLLSKQMSQCQQLSRDCPNLYGIYHRDGGGEPWNITDVTSALSTGSDAFMMRPLAGTALKLLLGMEGRGLATPQWLLALAG